MLVCHGRRLGFTFGLLFMCVVFTCVHVFSCVRVVYLFPCFVLCVCVRCVCLVIRVVPLSSLCVCMCCVGWVCLCSECAFCV